MGGGASKKQIQDDVKQELKSSPILGKLHLDGRTYEVMMKTFNQIDRKHDKEISLNEFLSFYKLENTYFTKLIFSRMDYGKSGSLDFEEYVVSIWDFLTSDLNHFVFNLYDSNDSGSISGKEFEHITRSAFNIKAGENASLDRMIAAKDIDGDGKLSFEEFEAVLRQNKSIQFPGFLMQNELMDRNGGKELWHQLKKERVKRFGKKDILQVVGKKA